MKILLVDDHQIIREGLKRILLSYYPSAEIQECANAEDVFSRIMHTTFDIIICDLSMPGRSGLDVVKQVKETQPNIPILIFSTHPEEQYAVRALKAGASGYVNKANGTEELLQAIERVLLGRKYISPAIVDQLADNLYSKTDQLHELLSDREFHVFKRIAEGIQLSEIAEQLSLSLSTVSTHRSRILAKMKMKSNADLIKYALQQNLL